MLAVGLLYRLYYKWGTFLLYLPNLFRVLIMKWSWIFSTYFSDSIVTITWFLSFILLMQCIRFIDLCVLVHPYQHLLVHPLYWMLLEHVCNIFNELLDSIYYVVENCWRSSHKGYWPIDSYCYCAFLLFWYQGNSGLIEWIGKNFLLLLFFPHNWSKIDVISSLNGWNSTVKPPGPKVYFRDFLWLIQSTSFIFHLLLKIITFSVSCFQILTFNHPTFNQNPTLFAFLLCCSKPTQCLYSHIQSSWDLDTPTKYYPRDSKVGAEAVAWFSDINFHPRFLENICYSLSVTEVSLQFVLMMMTTRKKLPGTEVGMSDRSTLW